MITPDKGKLSIMDGVNEDKKVFDAKIEQTTTEAANRSSPQPGTAGSFENPIPKSKPTTYNKPPEVLKIKEVEKSDMIKKIQDDKIKAEKQGIENLKNINKDIKFV